MKVNIGVIERGEWSQRWMAKWRDVGWWNGRQRYDGLNSASRNDGLDWIVIQEDRWSDSQLFSLPPFPDSILFIHLDSTFKDVIRNLLLFSFKFERKKQCCGVWNVLRIYKTSNPCVPLAVLSCFLNAFTSKSRHNSNLVLERFVVLVTNSQFLTRLFVFPNIDIVSVVYHWITKKLQSQYNYWTLQKSSSYII